MYILAYLVGLYKNRFEGADDSGKTRYNLGFPDEGNNRCLYSCKSLQHKKKNRVDRYRRINHLVIFLVYFMLMQTLLYPCLHSVEINSDNF